MKIKVVFVLWLLIAFLLALALVEMAIIVGKIALNSYPFVDEFCYAVGKKNVGLWNLFFDTYLYWSGRFVSNFLFLFNPLNFDSLLWFRVSTFICFSIFISIFFIPLKAIDWHSRFEYFCAWLFFVTLCLFFTHEIYVAVLNFTNAISYNISFAFCGMYFLAMSDRVKWSRRSRAFVIYASLIAIAGTAEQNVFLALAYLSFATVLSFIHSKRLRPHLDHWLFLLIIFLTIDMTSGNHLQFKERAFFTPLKAGESFVHMFESMVGHFHLPVMSVGLISLVIGGILIGYHCQFEKSILSVRKFLLVLSLSWFSHVLLVVLLVFAQGYMLAARQFYPIFYSLGFFHFYCSLLLGSSFRGNWRGKSVVLPIGLLVIILINYLNPLWKKNRDFYYFEIIDQYALEMDNIHKNYFMKKIDRIPIPIQHVEHAFLYPHIPFMWEKAGERFNACSGIYFGMPSVEFYIPQ